MLAVSFQNRKTMANEKIMTEQESLRLITDMIQKSKASVHERGTSAILWGTVTAIAGLLSFAQEYFRFSIGFDIWLIVFFAIVPQIYISIKESRQRTVTNHHDKAVDTIWMVYGISIAAISFYKNVVPSVTQHLFAARQLDLNKAIPVHIYSASSIFLVLYAIPTLATGLITKFKPMIIGGITSYVLFIISCYTPTMWDMLLLGIAGLCNWLIPGLMLRKMYLTEKASANV